MKFDFYAFVAEAEAYKQQMGLEDTPAATEALRNKGDNRTSQKRGMLARLERRAREAGRQSLPGHY
ncbi:MAG: hypothetical protein KGJ57_12630 [Sphingomonadales bacterium]|nr:hypothetical protein [Sphingomonadales bacterium]MDE2170259.1 hypothetical protein [Sphingomonadales bacterium]